jgi:hypothetical protein
VEQWREVVGWSGFYEVSDLGRVRAGPNRLHRGHVLKPGRNKDNGYLTVTLTRPGAARYCVYVHDLVTAAFIGPKPAGEEVRHRDGTRDNCRADNLHYGTRSSNALDRHEHGTMNQAHGEAHYFHKLTADDVRWIRANKGKITLREMGSALGVHHRTVQLAQNGKSWARVV